MTIEEYNQTLKDNSLVVVKFGADWCGPCRTLEETLSEIEPKYPNVKFLHIDAEESPDIVSEYKIRNIPVMLFIKDFEVQNKIVGAAGAQLIVENINAMID